jgi:hypothetical protein
MARKLDRLSVTLGKILKARGMQGRLHEYRIMQAWATAVGPSIARHAQPAAVRGGKLTLVVDHPAWMQQLSLLKPEIIGKLNGSLGMKAISDITLKFGEIERHESGPERRKADQVPLSDEERTTIQQSVHGIRNDEVREALQRLLETDVVRRKAGTRK